MDGRCVYLCLSIFVINFLSVTDGGKKLFIRDSFKVKPFDNRLEAKQLYRVVAKALTARFKNRKMLEVSKTRYNIHVAWRGIKHFFWEKVLNVFCPTITRELKAIQVLKDLLVKKGNNNLKNTFGFKLPFIKSQKKVKEESSGEESDEESDEDSDEESDEESDEKRNSKSKKGKKSKNKKDSDEDDDDDSDSGSDSNSDEEDKKKKKANNKSLDDLFK